MNYFEWERLPKHGEPQDFVREKAVNLHGLLSDNEIFAWYYFLTDAIPIITRTNILFQATLPLPHLLYDRVESARRKFALVMGQEPREKLIDEAEVTADTRFGPALVSFLSGCRRGLHEYGHNKGRLTRNKIGGLKGKLCAGVFYMNENLEIRFP